ncbi:acyl-CoA dehydrogenase family protein [Amycolatopsis sp. NPDC051372]|uniref:acyl-CoA dehydrogenase family protein n=1 Tax=Amycolatopsis sp. NPDC051372 TaxID=3155669 RepID=UPI00341FF18A
MDFTPDDTQAETTALSARVLGKSADAAEQWRALAGAGLLALALPADLGGDGLGFAEVAARADRSRPRGCRAALHEPSAPLTTVPDTVGEAADGVWQLTGVKTGVPYAADATRILTPVALPGGTAVALIDPCADGVDLVRTPSSGGSPEYTVRLAGVRLADTEFLRDRSPGHAVATLHRFALAGALALGDGLLAGALALTTRHLAERTQFGRPLAAFQAVAQQIADVYVAARTVHLAATSAGWRLAAGLDADTELDVAAYWLTDQAPAALATCHHLHGGLGVDREYPLHRYSSAVKDLGRAIGGAAHRLGRLGERVAG